MCGLTGVLLHPGPRSAEIWREVAAVVSANLVHSEERGRDATGLAVISGDGWCEIVKRPVPASSFVVTEVYKNLINRLTDGVVCILGHNRLPTKGSRWRQANNHPVLTDHVVGVHNGLIRNDDALFGTLGLPRAATVDSEIIFRLLDTVPLDDDAETYATEVKTVIGLLDGGFACLAVNLDRPGRLVVLKQLMPLCLHYEPRHRALYFSSRYVFLRKAFGVSVITEALDSGRGYIFDAEVLSMMGNRPRASFEIIRNPAGVRRAS